MKASDLILAWNDFKESQNAAYFERMNKETDGLDARPICDKDGRLHAPHDAFVWIDGNQYMGGQYLPDPWAEIFDMPFSKSGNIMTKKMLVSESASKLFFDAALPCTFGKTWEKNGIAQCYAYFNLTKSEYKFLDGLYKDGGQKTIVDVEKHGANGQKTWKFSSRKILAKIEYNAYYKSYDQAEYEWSQTAPGVELIFTIDAKGKGAYKDYSSIMDGKEVRYQYHEWLLIN